MKTITLDNLHKVKLSDLIESVIADIEIAQDNGFAINMGAYYKKYDNVCAVCLGGAAALGFMGKDTIEELKTSYGVRSADDLSKVVNHGKENIVYNMIRLFDELRSCDWSSVIFYYESMTGKHIIHDELYQIVRNLGISGYSGYLNKVEINQMIRQYTNLVTHLRKHDL
jgi:hypothetical protein